MFDAQIKQLDPGVVAFLEMHGPYARMAEGFGALYGWMGSHALEPAGMPRGVFFTDPAIVPEEESAWEIQVPLAGEHADRSADTKGFGVKHLEARLAASAMHRGPYESIKPTYDALTTWIAEQGYAIAGPPVEVYYSDPVDTAPDEYLTEVRFPVREV